MEIDPRNRLNGLSNSEWLRLTSSVWWNSEQSCPTGNDLPLASLQMDWGFPPVINSSPPPPDNLKRQHPATFAESDIRKLISFFSKKGDVVLDPFVGAGSTMLACLETQRNCIGIELFWKWVLLSRRRIKKARPKGIQRCSVKVGRLIRLIADSGFNYNLVCGDSRTRLKELRNDSVDLIITSPPYWSILEKSGDYKVLRTRREYHLPTNYGSSSRNLSNIRDYSEFVNQLEVVFRESVRVLRAGKYMCVIVADFRHENKFYPFHADLISAIERCGPTLEGITIIVNNRKHLYPYGMPYSYVSNIHHSYVLIFRNRRNETLTS
jgi:DNA modification methylase